MRLSTRPPARGETVELAGRVLSVVKGALITAIDLPLPTQQVLLHEQTRAADGNRSRQRAGWPAQPTAPAGAVSTMTTTEGA